MQQLPVAAEVVLPPVAAQPDEILVEETRRGNAAAFESLMRRHNQRVYRVVRSILRDPAEIEDVMQQAYLSAYTHLDQFKGAARWSTWVCRIAVNEALARLKQQGRFVSMEGETEDAMSNTLRDRGLDPEHAAANHQLADLVEQAVDALPDIYRRVVMMREVEGMTTAETAAVLEVDEDVVKTRLHRARTTLRAFVEKRVGAELESAFAFGNQRCARVVAGVLVLLAERR